MTASEARSVDDRDVPFADDVPDGLHRATPVTPLIVRRHFVTVPPANDREIREAVRFLLGRLKIVVEPGGAMAAAAVQVHKLPASTNDMDSAE